MVKPLDPYVSSIANLRRYSAYKNLHRWTAVARGAVIHGIQSLVDSRKLKEHYGVIMSSLFNPRFYDKDTAYFDPFYSRIMTSDHVEWFAVKVSSMIETLPYYADLMGL